VAHGELLGENDRCPKRIKLAILDHLDSPDDKAHGQPSELTIALLCESYPFLLERYAATDDGMIDVARLVRMRELLALYRTIQHAVRTPSRIRGRDGVWRNGWTDHEKTIMDRMMQLRRERDGE